MKFTPLIASAFEDGLVRFMVSVELPPVGIDAGENALLTVGAVCRVVVRLADAAGPVPELVEVTAPVELL